MPLRFSLVTPSYQHAEFIDTAIGSVLTQDYPYFEYVVRDGGSVDDTVMRLSRWQGQEDSRFSWLSEPDGGQAAALNAGFREASGDIFGWLNADDTYVPGALRAVAEFFTAHPEAQFVYGDAIGINRRGRSFGIREHVGRRQKLNGDDHTLLVGWYDFIVQPAAFWRAELWRSIGPLDATLRYALDYEYWMRAAAVTRLHYLPRVLACERLYGAAKTGTGQLARMAEIDVVARRHGGAGLPRHYHAEAAALMLHARVRAALTGVGRPPHQPGQTLGPLRPPLASRLKYTAFVFTFGPRSLPGGWLWLNRWRTWQRRTAIPTPPAVRCTPDPVRPPQE